MSYLDLKIGDRVAPAPPRGARPLGRNLLGELSEDALSEVAGLDWYFVRAATRQEATAEESLTEAGAVFYFPRLTRWAEHARKKRKVTQSLIEGYGFAAPAGGLGWGDLERLDGVHQVVRFGAERPPPASFRKIAVMAAQERAGHFDRTIKVKEAALEFASAEIVKVVDGGFNGFNAQFVRLTSKDRARVALMVFGRYTETELPIDYLRKMA